MKYFFLLILLTGFTCSFAQPEKEVGMSVEKLRLAMIDPTADVLKKLTAGNLSYGHSSGLIEDQNQFIEALVSGKSDFKTIDLSDQSIVMTNNSLALVRHKLKGELLSAGNVNVINLGVLLVWTKEKGEWKLVARQAFKL